MAEPVINADLTPRPVASYSELWGKDRDTLNAWCKKGWVPGAFKHASGEWWVRPLALIHWEPAEPEANHGPKLLKAGVKSGQAPAKLTFPEERS